MWTQVVLGPRSQMIDRSGKLFGQPRGTRECGEDIGFFFSYLKADKLRDSRPDQQHPIYDEQWNPRLEDWFQFDLNEDASDDTAQYSTSTLSLQMRFRHLLRFRVCLHQCFPFARAVFCGSSFLSLNFVPETKVNSRRWAKFRKKTQYRLS